MWPQGTGEPMGLTQRLMDQAPELPRCTLVLGMVTSPTLGHANAATFGYLCLNGAANTRKAVAFAKGRVVPAHVSTVPALLRERRIPVDVVLVRVRPTPDRNLYSLGVVVDFVHEMIEAARVVVAEVDERLPLMRSDALIEKTRIHHQVAADGPEPLIFDSAPTAIETALARQVTALIPDRATVQLGVGSLPTAVCRELIHHKDLGVHSGVIADAAVDLIEAGVITNRFKGLDEGATVTGGLFGSRRLMEFAHENAAISLRRATHTHNARILAQLHALHSINSCIAIDLSGQVGSEVASERYVGAVGGQVDYVRGARLSEGGRSIMALASVTADGKHSKIVPLLGPQPVTTARSDVDFVVTEHGVADLWGRDLIGRAEALIAIAHPAFQEQLERDMQLLFS